MSQSDPTKPSNKPVNIRHALSNLRPLTPLRTASEITSSTRQSTAMTATTSPANAGTPEKNDQRRKPSNIRHVLSNLQPLTKLTTSSELAISSRKSTTTAATMSPPNPATPPKNGVCPWSALPAEISDEILKLAYGTPDKLIAMLYQQAFDRVQEDKQDEHDDDEKPFAVSRFHSA